MLIIMTPENPPERRRRSYSQLNTYSKCGKQYQLEKIQRVPSRPMLNGVGGTAVHATIERYLRENLKGSM